MISLLKSIMDINLFLLIFLSLVTGVLSGFVGVGGKFIMTPARIILGLPAQFAVDTGIFWVMGNSIIGTLKHRRLGNTDIKLGLILIFFIIPGIEVGIRLLNVSINSGMSETAVVAVVT